MPVLQGKFKHKKIYRPPGTKYVQAFEAFIDIRSPRMQHVKTSFAVDTAFKKAYEEFWKEFNRQPDIEKMVVEMVADSSGIHVTIFEIPEEDE